MTKREIIEGIAKKKVVEKIISSITKCSEESLNDLAQDIYINLLEKDENYIVDINERKEIKKFIVGMVKNNYFSKTSRYFKDYKKWEINKRQIENEEGEETLGEC